MFWRMTKSWTRFSYGRWSEDFLPPASLEGAESAENGQPRISRMGTDKNDFYVREIGVIRGSCSVVSVVSSEVEGEENFSPSAQGSAARFAVVFAPDAVIDALGEQVEDQIVDTEGLRDVIFHAGVFGCGVGGEAGDVLGPVLAGAQEIGTDDDALGAAANAGFEGGGDGGLGNLHVRGFDDVIFCFEAVGEKGCQLFQHMVAGLEAGA